jgi:hypothetical protein
VPYTLKVLAEEGYVLLEHEGKVTVDEAREARDALLPLLAEHNLRRLLIDWRRASAFPQTAEFYFFVTESSASEPRIKCALVHSAESGGLAQFVENVARNRGISLNAFASRDQAVQWLLA